jgi:hypothetical protein
MEPQGGSRLPKTARNDAPAPAPVPTAPSIEPIVPVPHVDVLTQTVAISLKNLYGIYGIEIWYFNEGTGRLENIALDIDEEQGGRRGPTEGLLLKRVTQDADEINRKYWKVEEPQLAFKTLTDKSHNAYLAPGAYILFPLETSTKSFISFRIQSLIRSCGSWFWIARCIVVSNWTLCNKWNQWNRKFCCFSQCVLERG